MVSGIRDELKCALAKINAKSESAVSEHTVRLKMATPTDFDFTSHSAQRGLERGISKEDFISCVVSPDKKTQKNKGQMGGFVFLFEKNIKQKLLVVVAEVYKEKCNLITGYWNETYDTSDKL